LSLIDVLPGVLQIGLVSDKIGLSESLEAPVVISLPLINTAVGVAAGLVVAAAISSMGGRWRKVLTVLLALFLLVLAVAETGIAQRAHDIASFLQAHSDFFRGTAIGAAAFSLFWAGTHFGSRVRTL
jgi:hypothetical protein